MVSNEKDNRILTVKMKGIHLLISILLIIELTSCEAEKKNGVFRSRGTDGIMDVEDFSVYYDIRTNETIRTLMPRPWYKPGWRLRLPFTGGRCNCKDLKCICCTGIRIEAFNFDRRTCTILSFNPEDSMINMEVTMNNDSVYQKDFSARNPPPFCVPVPIPYLPPGLVDLCVRLFDISLVDQRLHVCMDMDTRVDMAPVLILHFDCMDMGLNGIGLSKPSNSSSLTNTSLNGGSEEGEPVQESSDIFDPVMEEVTSTGSSNTVYNNSIKYI